MQGRALDDVVVCSCRGETTQSLVRQRSRLGQTLTASSMKRRRASYEKGAVVYSLKIGN